MSPTTSTNVTVSTNTTKPAPVSNSTTQNATLTSPEGNSTGVTSTPAPTAAEGPLLFLGLDIQTWILIGVGILLLITIIVLRISCISTANALKAVLPEAELKLQLAIYELEKSQAKKCARKEVLEYKKKHQLCVL